MNVRSSIKMNIYPMEDEEEKLYVILCPDLSEAYEE